MGRRRALGAAAFALAGCAAVLDVHDPKGHVDAGGAGDAASSDDAGAELDAGDALPDSGLVLWLAADRGVDAANGRVVRWTDQSPAHADAVAAPESAPRVESGARAGLPVLAFDRGSSFLALPAGFGDFTAGLTATFVVRPAPVVPNPQTGAFTSRFFDFAPHNSQVDCILFSRTGSKGEDLQFADYIGASRAPAVASTGGEIVDGDWQLLGMVAGGGDAGAAMTTSLYANGVLIASQTSDVPRAVLRTSNLIGRSNFDARPDAAPFDPDYQGDLAEIVLYDRALEDAERARVDAYLRTKWGI